MGYFCMLIILVIVRVVMVVMGASLVSRRCVNLF